MPNTCIARKVAASTSGIDSATTKPVRKPSEARLTPSTMSTASASERTNSFTERWTACGWLVTCASSSPTGSSRARRAISRSRLAPSSMMSPPLTIDTPIPNASLPW